MSFLQSNYEDFYSNHFSLSHTSLSLPGREEEGPSKPIICYCTVGYRSSMAAQLLGSYFSREAGKTFMASPKIYNVCGGLVVWAIERRQMVDRQERPTSVVHPYSPTWAKLLEPEFRAEI